MDWNLNTAHNRIAEYLKSKNVEQPRLSSEILFSKTLGIKRIDIYTQYDRPVNRQELDAVSALAKRLVKGEPLQLIVGDCQFFSFTFATEPGVFVPRPETETLVDVSVSLLRNSRADKPVKILDICTGTGVVAVTMLKFLPNAAAVAVDISEKAVALARRNAESLGTADRLNVFQGDLFSTLSKDEKFDAVISNPPYIVSGDIPGLDAIVRDFDPRLALDGGPDGYDIINKIIIDAPDYMNNDSLLAMEVGADQAKTTLRFMEERGYSDCRINRDLSDVERVVSGWLRPTQ